MVSHTIYAVMYCPLVNLRFETEREKTKQNKNMPAVHNATQHYGVILNMELVVVSVISVCKIQQQRQQQ